MKPQNAAPAEPPTPLASESGSGLDQERKPHNQHALEAFMRVWDRLLNSFLNLLQSKVGLSLAVVVSIAIAVGLVWLSVATNNKFIPAFSLLLAATGLTIAFLSWQANVYGKSWREARERLLSWTRDCNEVMETLAHDPLTALQESKVPPFTYALRAYGHHELRRDLALMHGQTSQALWDQDYTERSVLESAATKMFRLTHHWRAVHGFSETRDKAYDSSELHLTVVDGHRRLCQFEEAVLNFKLCGVFESAVRRLRSASVTTPIKYDSDRHLISLLAGGIGDPTEIWMDS